MTTYKIEVLSIAAKDFQQAFDYYHAINPDLSDRLTAELYRVYDALSNRPHVHATRYKQVRVVHLKKFPFGVHYDIDETKQLVTIVAFFHVALHPGKWMRKM